MQSLNHPKQHTKSPRVCYLSFFLAQRYDAMNVMVVNVFRTCSSFNCIAGYMQLHGRN